MRKTKLLVFIMIAATISSSTTAQNAKTDSFKVYGNCGMCKHRIEKAVEIDGITKAEWNVDTKIMNVTFDSVKLKSEDIQQKIAAVGHDTEIVPAMDSVYNNLPGCCQYERRKKE
jgi:periplasmic mercuric ion binding protein